MTRPFWVSVGILGIAVWVLAAHTIGETIGEAQVSWSASPLPCWRGWARIHLPSVRVPEPLAGRLAIWLVGGGVVLLLSGLEAQFYLAFQATEHARRAADVAEQAARNGQRLPDVNIRASYPASVGAIGYACVLAGIGAMVSGVRVGVSAIGPGPAASTPERAALAGGTARSETASAPGPARLICLVCLTALSFRLVAIPGRAGEPDVRPQSAAQPVLATEGF